MPAKKSSAPAIAPQPQPPPQPLRWPLWRYVALALIAAGIFAAWQGVKLVVNGKLGQRLFAEMGPGLMLPGESAGTIEETLAACMNVDGGVVHLSRGAARGLRLQRFDKALKPVSERTWTGPEVPVALALGDGAVWVATKSGRVARLRSDLSPEPLAAGPLTTLRAMAMLPGNRAAGLDASGGQLVVWKPGEMQGSEPLAGRLASGVALAASADGRLAVAEAVGKRVRIQILGADGVWQRSFMALDLDAGPYMKVAWSGPSDLVVNDTSGPRGLLLFDADNGKLLGQAVQSRQHDHLFNVSFIAGAPSAGAFLVRTTNGISWGRLARPEPAFWNTAASEKEKP